MKPAKLLYLLRIVWEMGPCPNRTIAREAGLTPKACYVSLYELVQKGLVSHDEQEAYDITPDGLRRLKVPRNVAGPSLWPKGAGNPDETAGETAFSVS